MKIIGFGIPLVIVALLAVSFGLSPAKASPPAITVTTNGATNLERGSATLAGSVSTDGGSPTISEWGFEYGLTTDYGSTITAGGSPALGDFNASVSGLSCGTTYHMRAYAKYAVIGYLKPRFLLAFFANVAYATPPNSEIDGSDTTFTTSSCPSHPPPGTTMSGRIANLIAIGNTQEAIELAQQYSLPLPSGLSASIAAAATSTPFVRDLDIDSFGDDVKSLQRYLNEKGYEVATQGPGSAGNETDYFGPATKAALIRLQKASGIVPASGYFGPLTRAYVQSHQ